MKRSAPTSAAPERQSFQQPVSCQLCRLRKLKCDRGRPCFNCSSRNFDCVYHSAQGQPSQPLTKIQGSGLEREHSCASDCLSLLQRIQRLESAVFPSKNPEAANDRPTSSKSTKTQNSLHFNHDEEQQRTSEWFEGLLTELTATPSARTQMTASSTLGLSVILREFPSYSDAKVLLDIFTRTINAMYHILHIPTTSLWLEGLFAEISANLLPSATQLAFFLGIFAGAVYASKNDLHFETAGLCGVPQMTLAESWLKQAVFLLTNPLVPASTQALQTFANLAHLCTQIEGFSGSLGILTISGARMAKSMKIHRLDTFHYREERKKDGADMIDIEVKRRIWWHIVSSDWLRSTVGGPDEGTYIFHPQQMEIFHPSNVDDDDIPTGVSHLTEDSYSLPLSSPTSITYFLYRIQAANLSREVTDNLPPSFFVSPGTHDSDEIYQKIIVLDQKYQQFLKSLPPFFQLTIRQDEESYRALIKERPYLEWQRYLINFVIHTHLARLHRPFLIRGSTQHRFAYSRMQCIRSAETVLEIRNFNIGNEGIGGFTYILAHFMMAAVILAMDVCFNQDEIRVSQRKQEVLQACRVLEEELNTKIAPPCSGAENESCSSGQLMLQSFQRAVQNLRGILRRKGSKDKPLQSSSGTIIENTAKDPLPTKEIYTMPQRQRPSALHPEPSSESGFTPANENISNQRHSNVSLHMDESSRDQNDQGQGSEPQRQQQQSPFNLPPPYDEHIHSHQIEGSYGSSGELIADELWSEFFTVGPTFNDVDWNTFLIDFENQITKV